ncbi:MAG: hypothetical protein JWL80_11 [Parcubacteria group bacterium]|nr:hypothetical protein [Parcubacteria group bacterium]
MRVPYAVQCALFAPSLVLLIFILKITCPVETGNGCFVDPFISSVFFPLPSVYRLFGQIGLVATHEPLFILLYWTVVGFLVGVVIDVYKSRKEN